MGLLSRLTCGPIQLPNPVMLFPFEPDQVKALRCPDLMQATFLKAPSVQVQLGLCQLLTCGFSRDSSSRKRLRVNVLELTMPRLSSVPDTVPGPVGPPGRYSTGTAMRLSNISCSAVCSMGLESFRCESLRACAAAGRSLRCSFPDLSRRTRLSGFVTGKEKKQTRMDACSWRRVVTSSFSGDVSARAGWVDMTVHGFSFQSPAIERLHQHTPTYTNIHQHHH